MAAQTTESPHTNALAFSIPQTTPQQNYNLTITVTSSKNGLTRSPLNIALEIIPIQATTAIIDPNGIFQDDGAGSVDSDTGGDVIASPTAPPSPDFAFTGTVGSATTVALRTAAIARTTGFDPTHPPADLTVQLLTNELFAKCVSAAIPDNGAHDGASGTSPGFQTGYGYCIKPIVFGSATFDIQRDGYDIPHRTRTKSITDSYPCVLTNLSYLNYSICETAPIMMYPVSGKSEMQQQGVSLNISGPPEIARSRNYYINAKGVFYPEISALPQWGPTIKGKYVSSPGPGNWLNCTASMMITDQLYCHGSMRHQLASNLRKANYDDPSIADPSLRRQRFEAHHTQPIGWGGSNEAFNGVWLPKASHQQLTNWFNKSSFQI